jgi:hypothetical protein
MVARIVSVTLFRVELLLAGVPLEWFCSVISVRHVNWTEFCNGDKIARVLAVRIVHVDEAKTHPTQLTTPKSAPLHDSK